MKIIQPTFDLHRPENRSEGIRLLQFVERMARISHRSEDRQTEDSWLRFLTAVVLEKGDWSVTEHASATVIARVDRGVTHEWVRHRIGAYTQESTRFVNAKKKYGEEGIEFLVPVGLENVNSVDAPEYREWRASLDVSERQYSAMLAAGCSPQTARSVLPNALASTIAVTYNLRNWRHFFMMRTTRETHPDFRRLTIPMLKLFQERVPLLYDDIVPEQKQSESLSKPR